MNDIQTRISMQTSPTYLRQLIQEIKSERIGIPLFQRKFVWNNEQVCQLFDSISKGYPIGSFLIWERDGDWEGTLELLTDRQILDSKPKSYILDGRQRLTTFFGCTLPDENKPEIFKLWYNLKNRGFQYKKESSSSTHLIKVSDIFDTFRLLGKMEDLRKQFPEEEADLYIQRAKELNSLLQEYMVSKVTISDCSLEEATDVFSRLNSQGTDISKAYMIQALSYKKQGDPLLVPELEKMQEALAEYDYDSLDIDELLTASYKFANKNFFDLSLKEKIGLRPLEYRYKIKETVTLVVKFLYEFCGILSWKILPYAKQFQALVWFFRKHPFPTDEQKKELRKWVYYTGEASTFQNGSMGNTRRIFLRFEEYVKGSSLTPIDYNPFEIPKDLKFRFSKRTAMSKMFLLTLVKNYNNYKDVDKKIKYLGACKFGDNNPENYFVLLNEGDKEELNIILNTFYPYDESALPKHSLTGEMVEAYREGNIKCFKELRKRCILSSKYEQLKKLMPELISDIRL
ncbi:MAG: DUF262 domain-containing protein [Muribaculaceae bacterium]|nr:DUF262 domain-containing protein [Muribaculaceae bacterium]